MPTIVDSYGTSNQNSAYGGTTYTQFSQSFAGNSEVLQSVQFYIKNSGSYASNTYVEIYAHTGTYGTSSLPTGALLATSGTVNGADIGSGSYSLVTYTFTGANKITLSSTYYCAVLRVPSEATYYINVGTDVSSPTHGGNFARYDGTWQVLNNADASFYVYSDAASTSPSASISPSASRSPSSSISPSASLSPSSSSSLSLSPSASISPSSSRSPSASLSPSSSISSSPSSSLSPSSSISSSVSSSLSPSASLSPSSSTSPSSSSSLSLSPSASYSSSISLSPSQAFDFPTHEVTAKEIEDNISIIKPPPTEIIVID